jgi:hypothetical protein
VKVWQAWALLVLAGCRSGGEAPEQPVPPPAIIKPAHRVQAEPTRILDSAAAKRLDTSKNRWRVAA